MKVIKAPEAQRDSTRKVIGYNKANGIIVWSRPYKKK